MDSAREPGSPGRWVHRLFVVGVVLKGIDGVLEIAGGLFLYFVSRATLTSWLLLLLHDELVEDPSDLVANYLLRLAEHLSIGTKTFAAIYLMGHGVIKVVLVVNLMRNKRWAYPAAVIALSLFIGYEVYRLTWRYSVELTGFALVDMLVTALIWQEYRRRWRRAR